ncbi:MAG: stalk domain-containing protein [Bacillota bacterium]|nr:hypothetical protein [Clostridia bacterium]
MRHGGLLFLLIIGVLWVGIVNVQAGSEIRIQVDGEMLSSDVDPIIEQGRTLVPLRVVMENLGAKVTYQHESKTVIVQRFTREVTLKINSRQAWINDETVTLDVPATIVANRTVIPLRFVGQSLGAIVNWEDRTKTVVIDSSQLLLDAEEAEQEVFFLVNKAREQQGLNPLVWMDELADIARAHSQDMAEHDFFAHISPSTGDPAQRAQAYGLPGAAENIAAGYLDAKTVFDAWMLSPDHRANILDPGHRFIGIGVFCENDPADPYNGLYWTQEFIKGETVLLSPLPESTVTDKEIKVEGYSTESAVELTVYKMVDKKTYSEKYTIDVSVGDDGKFSEKISLDQGQGLYAIQVSEYDFRYVEYQ